MSLPKAVFIDTCIYDRQHYNFTGTVLSSFVPVAAKASLLFLLPDPTVREVNRHIKDRSDEALNALVNARRKAPFLEKWKCFPAKFVSPFAEWEVNKIAQKEWQDFLGHFNVVKLDYDAIKLKTIMDWYDHQFAPFGKGDKRKEFPDAFTIASLAAYASKNSCPIAIVSEDHDFKKACERYPELFCFSSLPRLTELLLLNASEIEEVRDTIDSGIDVLAESVKEEAKNTEYHHTDEDYEVDDVKVVSASIIDLSIVGIGENECTVTFEAEVECETNLRWVEVSEDGPGYDYKHVGEVASVSGTAKIELSSDRKKLLSVGYLDFDQSWIEITVDPKHRYYEE